MSTSLNAAPPRADGTEADRRRSARKPHVAEAWVVSPTATRPADERVEVTALNLFRHGVAFELRTPLPAGAFFVMEIVVGEQRLSSEVRIVSCRPVEGGYEVGAEFC